MARRGEHRALAMAADVGVPTDWMEQDVLTLAGSPLVERQELYDFLVAELHRDQGAPPRIGPVVRTLRNHRTALLAFVEVLQKKFSEIARRLTVPLATTQAVCEMETLNQLSSLYGQRMARGQAILKDRSSPIHPAASEAMAQTPRASSIGENFHSRLRS